MLDTALTIATFIGTVLGIVISAQNIYKTHLEIKKLKRELEELNQKDSS